MVEAKVCIGFAITACDKTKTWSAVRPVERTKDAPSSLIDASCFPKIGSDFRADTVKRKERI